MKIHATWLISGILAASLSSLYAIVIWSFIRTGTFFPSNPLEAAILFIQILKLVTILSVKRLRDTKFTNILNIWAVEILAVPLLIGLSISESNPGYISLAGEVFLSWASAVLLVFPAFAIYKFTVMVQRGVSLTAVLPSAASVFAILTFLITATNQYTGFTGLSGLSQTIPSAIRNASMTTSPEVSVTGGLLYLSLILYAAIQWKGEAIRRQLDSVLILSLGATVAAVCWAYVAQVTNNALLDFAIPSLAIAAIVLLVAHGE